MKELSLYELAELMKTASEEKLRNMTVSVDIKPTQAQKDTYHESVVAEILSRAEQDSD